VNQRGLLLLHLPELRVLQDLPNNLLFFNEGDDPRGIHAFRAEGRIDFAGFFDQPFPGMVGGPGLGCVILYRQCFSRLPLRP
jgi:hypothetical protein